MDEAPQGRRPGRYAVFNEHARGGMGRIMCAFDEHIGREIAVKELLAEYVTNVHGRPGDRTAAVESRFLREARVTGQLDHPSIVPVYEIGRRTDGTLYYTMKLVRGKTLAAALEECGSIEQRLKLLPHFADMCNAVAYAHSRGILHRDIKPHNVMIGEFGETVVLDWGLAKIKEKPLVEDERFLRQMDILKEAAAGKTVADEALGTPSYMPPEQAWGDLEKIDERSDVYALGAVLYEILCGRPPFEGEYAFEVIGKVQAYGRGKRSLVPVREVEPASPPELAAVAHKALSAGRRRRYRSVKDLVNEVEAYMAGRKVGTYEYSTWELLRRFVKKNRIAVGSALVIVALMVVSVIALSLSYRRLEREHLRSKYNLASAYVEKSRRLVEDKNFLEARVQAAAALDLLSGPAYGEKGETARLTSAALGIFHVVAANPLLKLERTLRHPKKEVAGDAFSPVGDLVATGCEDGILRIWNVESGDLAFSAAGNTGGIFAVAFSPDGKSLATGGGDGKVFLWEDYRKRRPVLLGRHDGEVWSVEFSGDGRFVLSSSLDGKARLWNVSKRSLEREMSFPMALERVVASPDGTLLAVAGDAPDALLVDAGTGLTVHALEGHGGHINWIDFSPDGKQVATASEDTTVRLWDVGTGKLVHTMFGHKSPVWEVDFSPDGSLLASAALDNTVKVWSSGTGTLLQTVSGHSARASGVRFSPDSRFLLSTSYDGTAKLWRLTTEKTGNEKAVHVMVGHKGIIRALKFSFDGKYILTGGEDGAVKLWDSRKRALLATLDGHRDFVTAVAFSGDGLLGASGGDDKMIILWDIAKKSKVKEWKLNMYVKAVSFSPDGRFLAACSDSNEIVIWNLEDDTRLCLKEHSDWVTDVLFSPDGRFLASSSYDGKIIVRSAADNAVAATLDPGMPVNTLAFSHDSGTLAAGTLKKYVVKRWSTETWEPLGSFRGHNASILLTCAEPCYNLRKWYDNGIRWRQGSTLVTRMKTRDMKPIEEIKSRKDLIARKFGVKRIGVFGSFARGEENEQSDIDILVEFMKDRKTFDNYMELKFFMEDLFKRPVDLVTIRSLRPELKQKILEEVVYA
ncbi:MAG: protein kinase [Pseudomonadota bacterium]